MPNTHDILKNIPYELVISEEERFALFKLGIFTIDNTEEIVELVELQPKAIYRPHYHKKSSAMIYMILGEGTLILGEDKIPYHPGLKLEIPAQTRHGFMTQSKTLFLSIQSPPILNRETGKVDLHYANE